MGRLRSASTSAATGSTTLVAPGAPHCDLYDRAEIVAQAVDRPGAFSGETL